MDRSVKSSLGDKRASEPSTQKPGVKSEDSEVLEIACNGQSDTYRSILYRRQVCSPSLTTENLDLLLLYDRKDFPN